MKPRFLFVALLGLVALWGAPLMSNKTQSQSSSGDPPSAEFHMDDLIAERAKQDRSYLPFLNRKTLSCGIYFLEAGAVDGQSPHQQDEVYYVQSGKAKLRVEDQELDAVPGAVLFVAAGAQHKFHSIESDLTLLVFFSTAKP